eukprot:TRINITY_DN9591_c0_g1_i4.p1 TRINITY_DN9591_c0_g1~~TRINITY_DN9591_c0_g1_i4.p1  ORF type:complete len:555 (-),score=67.90 TRINITY_DN9591_c0_g1_i4:16-1527(-)
MVADDYGWANIGYHSTELNAKEIQTPTLNSLCKQGVELDRHYTYQFCSPSRCAFLSGRNPIHVNALNNVEFHTNPNNTLSGYSGISLNMTLVSEKLRSAGYSTHFTGKWDVGFATPAHLPVNRGFDTGLGYHMHQNDYWTFGGYACNQSTDLWYNHAPAYSSANPKKCNQQEQEGCVYEDDLFTSHVLKELDAHDPSTPLFYYWAHHNVHLPLEAPTPYVEKFNFINDTARRFYAAMVNHLDTDIAQVVKMLHTKGMWDNTLILFLADNGGPTYINGGANNYPLKGSKLSNWEGGIRVNAFISGGYVPEAVRGTKLEDFIAIEDWYATLSSLAGVNPFDDVAKKAGLPPVDGVDLWPLLSGQNKTNPRTEIHIGQGCCCCTETTVFVQGIIEAPYKLLIRQINESFWQGPLYPNSTIAPSGSTECGEVGCLFNVVEDPSEYTNIVKEKPEIAKRLRARIAELDKTVFNPDRGVETLQKMCNVFNNDYHGFIGPFVRLNSTVIM